MEKRKYFLERGRMGGIFPHGLLKGWSGYIFFLNVLKQLEYFIYPANSIYEPWCLHKILAQNTVSFCCFQCKQLPLPDRIN